MRLQTLVRHAACSALRDDQAAWRDDPHAARRETDCQCAAAAVATTDRLDFLADVVPLKRTAGDVLASLGSTAQGADADDDDAT